MKYIVKLNRYKHRVGLNLPIKLVREQGFTKYKYAIMEKLGAKNIIIRGYTDGEKIK